MYRSARGSELLLTLRRGTTNQPGYHHVLVNSRLFVRTPVVVVSRDQCRLLVSSFTMICLLQWSGIEDLKGCCVTSESSSPRLMIERTASLDARHNERHSVRPAPKKISGFGIRTALQYCFWISRTQSGTFAASLLLRLCICRISTSH